jgi:excisionase family DNA binding protein
VNRLKAEGGGPKAEQLTPVQDAGTVKLPPGEKYFTRGELAGILKVSLRTVDAMIADQAIPFLRLGKMIRFRIEDVERHLAERFLVREGDTQQ